MQNVAVVLSVAATLTLASVGRADTITARGSDSTVNVVKSLADAYQKKTGVVRVEGGGSSKGAKGCLAGEVDLAFLSRGLKDKEKDVGLVGFFYAIDGVAVIVNKKNSVDDLTVEQLRNIFTGKTGKWDNGKPIVALNRPASSGTRECFQDVVLGKNMAFGPKVKVKHHKAAMNTVRKAVTAIAYTSAGSLRKDEAIKVVKVNGVEPTPQTLNERAYPISRELHFATNGEPSSASKAFIDFVLSPEG